MDGNEQNRVWHYSKPGESPRPVILPIGVDAAKTADEGRWRGITCCCKSEECGTWMSDIDPQMLELALPLRCPECHERGGYPQLTWREARVDCQICGSIAAFGVIDPSEDWPEFVDCPNCEAAVRVPVLGTALFH